MIPDTMRKGYAGENYVMGDLTFKGMMAMACPIPTSEFDIVVYYEGRFVKIQVKSGQFRNGKMIVDCRRPSSKLKNYTSDDYDVLAVVELTSRKVAYLPYKERSKVTLYNERPKTLRGFQLNNEILEFDNFTEFPAMSEVDNHLSGRKEAQ